MKTVAVIGTGVMGKPMAEILIKKGFPTVVFDADHTKTESLKSIGASVAASLADAAERADAIVLSLPNVPVLQQVIAGPNGLLSVDFKGKTILDTTTSTMKASIELAERVASAGGWMLDCPVTGGEVGARAAVLSIMVGGDKAAFEAQRDVLEALGSTIVHIGPCGHGQVSKMVNQMLMAAIYCSVTESFSFAAQLGVDISKIYDAVEHGGGKSGLLSGLRKGILSGQPVQNHNMAQHGKDIDYVMEEASRHHSFVPVAAAVHETFKLGRVKGLGVYSSGSMFLLWEDLLGMKLADSIRKEEQ
ncbi:NAD(P)-dependent oxidoreductase [Paenibacillus piri]|uniref:NAD(P)-dependent oxidoreductase n=1 Tax=Paenibacillus piri TaxID=2547395 RepID=A0A4R5KWG4_9BACL|nr:NAD(P)-dependent oxidoreductase [Paenibacillus piri]TDF99518.1 NAD(P)-dependent oxidoreductase [Paenibacillus piri]